VPGALPWLVTALLLFAGLACLSLLAGRNMALFAMGAGPFVARCLCLIAGRLSAKLTRLAGIARMAAAGVLIVFLAGAAWGVTTNRLHLWLLVPHEFGAGVLENNLPIKAAAFVREMRLPGRLFCDLTKCTTTSSTCPTCVGCRRPTSGRNRPIAPGSARRCWTTAFLLTAV